MAEIEVTGEAAGELPGAPATVTARDYSFETSGLKPGRITFKFDNVGKEPHHMIAFRIKPGKTIDDVKASFQQEESQGEHPIEEEPVGGTAVLDGGTSQNVEAEVEAGNYALVCFITDRAGGPPHVAKGMVSEAKVE